MEIGADGGVDATALVPRGSVVAVTRDHATERRAPESSSVRPGMVLEAGHRCREAVEIDVEEHVADQAPVAGDRLVREEAGPRHRRPVTAAIAATEQLIAAAHGEQRRSVVDGGANRIAASCEIGRNQRLLAILTAADVDQIECRRLEASPGATR